MKKSSQSGFAAVEALLIVVIIAIVAGTGYFVWHAKRNADESLNSATNSQQGIVKASKVTDFASCKAAASSKMLETYPEQCVTKDGKTYTDAGASEASKWQLVTSKNNGFSVRVPDGWAGTNYGGTDQMRFTSIAYAKGAAVSMSDAGSPYAGDSEVPFSIQIAKKADYSTPNGTVSDFKAGSLTGKRYRQAYTESTGPGLGARNAGDVDYTYVVPDGGTNTLYITYSTKSGQTSDISVIDMVLATIKLN